MLTRIALVMFVTAMAGMTAMADPAAKELGLQSGGGPWQFYPADESDSSLPNVLLIGDSIMNGYRSHVIAGLKSKANVDCWLTPVHLKSKGLHEDLAKVASFREYDVVHFNIGLHGWTPGRIPQGQYEPLLRKYIEIIKSHSTSSRLIWANTTQITVKGKPTELDPVHNQTIVDRNAIAARVMPEYGIAVNDLYDLMSAKLEMARGDRFHWNGAAYQLMAKQVVRHIETATALNAAETTDNTELQK